MIHTAAMPGAIFGALDSASGDTPDYLPEPGEWIWTQLLVHRIEPSLQFYRIPFP